MEEFLKSEVENKEEIKRPWQGIFLSIIIFIGTIGSVLSFFGVLDYIYRNYLISLINIDVIEYFFGEYIFLITPNSNKGIVAIILFTIFFINILIIYLLLVKNKSFILYFYFLFVLFSFLYRVYGLKDLYFDYNECKDPEMAMFGDCNYVFLGVLVLLSNILILFLIFSCLKHPFYNQKKNK